jgi:hypothetical protein
MLRLRKQGGWGGRKRGSRAPTLTVTQSDLLRKLLGDRLGKRDGLVYTQEFAKLRDNFNRQAGLNLSRHDFWRALSSMSKKTMGKEVKTHLQKARESACLAVEIYNKPLVEFKSGGFIVLMCVAWTSLFHALFFRKGIKPFYRQKDNPRRYMKVDGDYKAWELATCLKHHFGGDSPAARRNLEFFIGLRNKIEHRSMPELDPHVFGECQALLFNFEDMLFYEFGPEHAMNQSLTLALQFSHLRDENQSRAVTRLHKPLAKNVEDYLNTFRSALSADVRSDLQYSYKLFLVPKVANRSGHSENDLAVEFVRYDPDDADQMRQYEQVMSLMKPVMSQALNVGGLKASDVCKQILPVVQVVAGKGTRFTASSHHVRAWKFYNVRPPANDPHPEKTNTKYCYYDVAHKDYLFTHEWVAFLQKEFRKPGQFQKVMEHR